MYCCSNNGHGQIGDGTLRDSNVVKINEELPSIIKISSGAFHNVAIDGEIPGVIFNAGSIIPVMAKYRIYL